MCEDGVTVVFELVVQAAKSRVDGFLRYLLDWADTFLFLMRNTNPVPNLIDILGAASGATGTEAPF